MDYKPVTFCWACGRKLWNKNKPTVRIIDGHPRTLHKFCAKHVDWMSQVNDNQEIQRIKDRLTKY